MNKVILVLAVGSVFGFCKCQNALSMCFSGGSADPMAQCLSHLGDLANHTDLFSDPKKALEFHANQSDALSTFCESTARTAIVKFYECMYPKLESCAPGIGMLFPDPTQAALTLTYVCENRHDIDQPCLAEPERYQDSQKCVINTFSHAPDVSTEEGIIDLTCSMFHAMGPCTQDVYGECPKRTAAILAQSLMLLKPRPCEACCPRVSLLFVAALLIIIYGLKE